MNSIKGDVINITISGYKGYSYTISFGKHIHTFTTETVKATCNTIGYTLHTCTNSTCGYSYKDELVEATGNHNFKTEKTSPTCVSYGYTTAYCTKCYLSYDYDYVAPNPNAHEYYNNFCSECGTKNSSFTETEMTLDKTINANTTSSKGVYLSFTPQESGWYTFLSSASSSVDSYAILYDSNMNFIDYNDDISSSNYNFKLYSYLEANQKYYLYVDTYENSAITVPVKVFKHNHSYSKKTKSATCGSKGYTGYVCNCGVYYYDTITPATNKHKWETMQVVEPTCTEDGYTIQECSVCSNYQIIDVVKTTGEHKFTNGYCEYCDKFDEITSSFNKQISLGSNNVSFNQNNQEAVLEFTPDDDGAYLFETTGVYDTYGKLCDANGTVIMEDNDSGVANNCRVNANLTKGNTYYFIVRAFEELSVDINVNVEQHTHNFVNIVMPPTCNTQGYTTYTCKDCLYQYSTDFVPATNEHSYSYGICTECASIDPSYNFDILNENGNTTVMSDSILCFTPSYSCDYTIKSNGKYDVGALLIDESLNIIDIADSNNTDDFNFTITTKLKAGTKYYLIVYASTTDEFTVSTAVNHQYKVKTVSPTCTEKGYTVDSCTVCGTTKNVRDYTVALGHNYVKTKVVKKATTKANGEIVKTCSRCGDKSFKVYYPKTITLSATSYTYDGKVKKPTVTVKDSKGNKIATSNYTVTYASGCKNVGSYNVTIKFKGNYSGTITKTFKINPKGTTISKLTATSKGFKATWKKQATQTTGYQIRYSTKSNMSGAKTVTISKNSTTSKTISKLSAKKKYYVQIRTYKTVNGTKYYSAWSSSKTVITNK